MLSCEVALYPQDTTDSDEVVRAALKELAQAGIAYDVGPVSTFLTGESEAVWKGLRLLFTAAAERGQEVALVATVTNSKV
jgi:uncharacterized protein YqgV (UPF0045/DUF77 family)